MQLNVSQHKLVSLSPVSLSSVFYRVSDAHLASCARLTSRTESFSRDHDPITLVHRAKFLTDVGGPLLSVSLSLSLSSRGRGKDGTTTFISVHAYSNSGIALAIQAVFVPVRLETHARHRDVI